MTQQGDEGRPTPEAVAGVYILFLREVVCYIGCSKDVYRRIAQHRVNGRQFDFAAVMPVPVSDCKWIERALIRRLSPAGNTTHNSAARRGAYTPPAAFEPELVAPLRKEVPEFISISQGKQMVPRGLASTFRKAVQAGHIPARRHRGGATLLRSADLQSWLESLIDKSP